MAKRNGNHSSKTPPKYFIGEGAEEKPVAKAPVAKDILEHDAKMAQAVEQRVAEAAPAVVQAQPTAAASADRLAEMAASELLKREADQARAEKAKTEARTARAAEQDAAQARSLKGRAVHAADALVHTAEERLEKLPEPVKKLGHAIERTAAIAFWPARFGLRLLGEVLRTPVAFARILFRSREA